MLPCAIRRRRASGDMSTSWIWSAVRTTSSGTVSRCTIPVIRSTSSLSDSRCWMLTVVMTSPPGQHRVEVHLGEGRAAVGHLAARHHLEPLELGRGLGTVVGLDVADDDVG